MPQAFTSTIIITKETKHKYPCATIIGWLIGQENDIPCDHSNCWKSFYVLKKLQIEQKANWTTPHPST
jgi:hypothetical protein